MTGLIIPSIAHQHHIRWMASRYLRDDKPTAWAPAQRNGPARGGSAALSRVALVLSLPNWTAKLWRAWAYICFLVWLINHLMNLWPSLLRIMSWPLHMTSPFICITTQWKTRCWLAIGWYWVLCPTAQVRWCHMAGHMADHMLCSYSWLVASNFP